MKRIKAWLLRWLGAVSEDRAEQIRESGRQELLRMSTAFTNALGAGERRHDAQIAELVQELNALRNSKQPVGEQKKPVRVIPSWGTFRTAVESQPKPIKIERNA